MKLKTDLRLSLCNPVDDTVHGLLRQEYWSGLPCPPPGNLPDPGVKSMFLVSTALTGGSSTTSATWEAPFALCLITNSHRRKKPRGKPRINFSDDLKGLSPYRNLSFQVLWPLRIVHKLRKSNFSTIIIVS